MHSGPFGCLTKLGAKRAELVQTSCHELPIGIFATNTPDPPHWTLNRRFGEFHTIWVHSGPFGCIRGCWAKLVQKFEPQSRVGIFRNEYTRYSQLDTKIMFWCVSYYLVAFGTIWLPYETRCKTGRTSAKVRATKSRRNFSQRTHPIHLIGH